MNDTKSQKQQQSNNNNNNEQHIQHHHHHPHLYAANSPQTPQQDTSTQRSDKPQSHHSNQNSSFNMQDASFYIENLKRGYLERLEQYQVMISDTCIQLEGDEMISAVKDDRDMEQFRVKRFQEIVGEQLRTEQELYIDKMIEENAMLHLNVKKAEESRDVCKGELNAITERVLEFERRMQSELAQKDLLQVELEEMKRNEIADRENYDRYLKMKEQSYSQSEAIFKTELTNSRFEIETLRKEKTELVFESEQLKEQTTVLSNNIEMLLLKLQARQENDRQADARNEELKHSIQRLTQSINEANKEKEIMAEKIMAQVKEIKAIQSQLDEVSKENDFLASNTENLKIKAAKTESLISEKTSEIGKKLEKVKSKKKVLKESVSVLKSKLENAGREIDSSKRVAHEKMEDYERTIAKMKSDMMTIRNEWGKQCQSIELNSQAQLLEMKQKHEGTISRIQGEYQNLLEKKINEMEEQARQVEMEQSKGVSMQRLERDYISKQQHAQILEEEIDSLQQRHQETLNQIVQKHHQNITDKIKEISDRKAKEYDILSQSLQANCIDLQNALAEQMKVASEQKERLLEMENNSYKVKEINHVNSSEIKELRLKIEQRDSVISEKESEVVHLLDQIKKQEQHSSSQMMQLKSQEEALQNAHETVEQLQNKLAQQQEQTQIVQAELSQLQVQYEELEEVNASINRQLETIRLKQSSEKDSAMRTVQFQETLKLDKEKEEHDETRRKFEKKQRALEKELSSLKDESEERLAELSEQLKRVTNNRDRIEAEKKSMQIELNSVQGRFEKSRQDSFRIVKRLALQMTSLGKDVDELRSDVAADISSLHALSISTTKSVVAKAKEVRERDAADSHAQFVQEKQEIILNSEERIEQMQAQQADAVVKLRTQIEGLTSEIHEVQIELECERKAVAQLQRQNAKLDQTILKNSEDMQQHNEDLSGEMSRIKEEANQLMKLQLESAQTTHKREIEALQRTVQEQEDTIAQNKQEIQKEMLELQNAKSHVEELIVEGDKKDDMIERLREQLIEVSSAYENVQEENNEAFEILEGKLAEYKKAITSEAEKYRMMKENSNLEIKQLHEEMNMLRHHLSLKGNGIDTMAKYHELTAFSKANQANSSAYNNFQQSQLQTLSGGFSSTSRQQAHVPPMINTTAGLPKTLKHNSSHSQLPTTPVMNSNREKSHAKKSSGPHHDRSFDASRLDALTEMSRQHKMKVQQMLGPIVGSAAVAVSSSNSNSGVSQVPTKDHKHDSPAILYEIKHLLAQSYDLVNKSQSSQQQQQQSISGVMHTNNSHVYNSLNQTAAVVSGNSGVDYSKKNHLRISHRSTTTVGDMDADEENARNSIKNSQFGFARVPPRSMKNENTTQSKSPTPTAAAATSHRFNFGENYPDFDKRRARFDSLNN